ncbi:MAG: hypothetical protein ACPLSY_04820 [Moorellaceae bacterium]
MTGSLAFYVLIVAVGAGLAAAGSVWSVVESGAAARLKRATRFPPVAEVLAFRRLNLRFGRREKLAAVVGAVTGMMLAWGSLLSVMLSAAAGYGCAYLWAKLKAEREEEARRREVFTLFDTLELYLRAGMPLQHALAAAKVLVPGLREAINAALVYWPSGSERALETLRRGINLPEGDILVSLLAQINQAGVENLEGVIYRETRRLEEVRETAARVRISMKPLYLVIYRALPLVAALGLVAGTLLMRAIIILREAGMVF